MVKRTYSRYGKGQRSKPYDPNWVDDIDNSKRVKVNDSDDLRIPKGRMEMKSSIPNKGSKFSGPTSLPEDPMDVDAPPEFSKNKTDVFDRVINSGRYQPARPVQFKARGHQNDVSGTSSTHHKSPYHSRYYQLPTPPAELQKTRHAHEDALGVESLSDSTHISEVQTQQPYVPKVYKAANTPTPRRNIAGYRLSTNSKESALWHANQCQSPLLQLPAEIRSTIFKYVLGGNTINIGYETYRNAYNQPTSSVPIFKYHCDVYDRAANPFKIKPSPNEIITYGYNPLNNVCRQLYVETAILPYSLNLIAFSSATVMFNFLYQERRLSRQQRNAITRLVLPDGLLQQNMLSDLGGLKDFFLGRTVVNDAKGWYTVVRKEGHRPELVLSSSLPC